MCYLHQGPVRPAKCEDKRIATAATTEDIVTYPTSQDVLTAAPVDCVVATLGGDDACRVVEPSDLILIVVAQGGDFTTATLKI